VPRFVWSILLLSAGLVTAQDTPVASDSRLIVEKFAAAPDIVHPIAADFDSKGRLLVVESHTHFRPANYKGPKFDRIRIIEDTDGDGKADKFTTFFEGTTATMDVACHPDGSVYIATRNEILRLRDTKGTGTADEKTRIAFLDTVGNYPHNGLSGLTFDSKGNLYFGMGENIGEPYKLIGADGKTIAGGGEGGHVFWITADGKNLREVATGFWNPFGSCRDIFGRLLVVDNDPDASPPCRMVHVVEGGDYGFQFRYGRAGRHPFQAWNGELPGTLPYMSGTGEAPCEIIAYESDGLPQEYRGDYFVPAWADHRVERYVHELKGATIAATRKPFVQGGKDFYPSGLAVAPDGSLFVSDWGSKSYELHGKGAIWHIRWKDYKPVPRPTDPKPALLSAHRPVREAAARTLAKDEAGRQFLRHRLANGDVRERATALTALIDAEDKNVDLATIASSDTQTGIREMAVRALVRRGDDTARFAEEQYAATVRAEAIAGLKDSKSIPMLVKLLGDSDPYIRHAAIHKLGGHPEWLTQIDHKKIDDPKQQIGLLLAWRASRVIHDETMVRCLTGADPDARVLAAKWIADERLTAYRDRVVEELAKPTLDPRGFIGLSTTLARLDNKPVNEDALAVYFLDRLKDPKATVATKVMALRGIPANHKSLPPNQLASLLDHDDPMLRIEALRALKDRADPKLSDGVLKLLRDEKQPSSVRAQAIVTLAATNQLDVEAALHSVAGDDAALRQEALRGFYQTKIRGETFKAIAQVTKGKEDCTDLVARLFSKPFYANRPPATDIDAWVKRLDGPADAEAGRRIFEHPKITTCAKCHRVEGRGADVGPDLSLIGRTDKRWIVESILQPSASVAPHYQTWRVDTVDGKYFTGLLVNTYLDESTYVDAKGDHIKVLAKDVADITAAKMSIMPDGLVDTLTDQEIRDLVAYLLSRK
jgi:putative membrane-bound dehydrogenase-like protein